MIITSQYGNLLLINVSWHVLVHAVTITMCPFSMSGIETAVSRHPCNVESLSLQLYQWSFPLQLLNWSQHLLMLYPLKSTVLQGVGQWDLLGITIQGKSPQLGALAQRKSPQLRPPVQGIFPQLRPPVQGKSPQPRPSAQGMPPHLRLHIQGPSPHPLNHVLQGISLHHLTLPMQGPSPHHQCY